MDDRVIGCFRKTAHPMYRGGNQGWEEAKVADTLNVYDTSESRTPIVIVYEKQQEILVFKERAGCPGGGKGILIGENKSFTLSTLLDEAICFPVESIGHDIRSTQFYKDPGIVCYASFSSNSMESSNPHSGIYEAKTSRALDLNGGNPACNQGGVLVVMEKAGGQHG